jgi:hypothetical protein
MTLTSQALDLMHRRPGRKRQDRARRPDGKADGEMPAAIVATATAYRLKFGADEDHPLDSRYGSTIGQLHLAGLISDDQHHAAQRYLTCVVAYCQLMGIPSPHPRSCDALLAGAGLSCTDELPDERVIEIRRRFSDARRALLDAGREIGVGARVNAAVYRLVIEDRPWLELAEEEMANVRIGLNALCRAWR